MYFELPGQISFWTIFVGTNLLFFPMHIVGLLGMPRRQYTYPSGLGWDGYNLVESIGGYITAVGILVLFGNLVWSYLRGEPAPADPWHGGTLEWTVPSPPPEYNFAVIPRVTSAYPNWDAGDREVDRRNLEQGVFVLEQGHEQPVSSPADGFFSEVVHMPHESPWPIVLALCLSLMFATLVIGKFWIAAIFVALCALSLLGWHSTEPQEAS
jgi:heme/copper-type cytochrome/quinol oxidase subunit 1